MHIWEAASGDLAFTLDYADGAVRDLRFGSDSRTLVTANHREAIVWSLKPRSPERLAAGPETLWNQLGHPSAALADEARWLLLDSPDAAIGSLRSQVLPSAAIDERAVRQLISSLDAARVQDRARATAELRALGRRALPFLRSTDTKDSLEWRRRVESLVSALADGPTEEERRHIRAVELLEQIGTGDAWTLIRTWAAGAPGSVLTEEARRGR